ncbi:MAG TPA: tyrosine-type recombinase/integrase [Bdellovibrionota bacterium]|jgi:site-specific recombinase XerD|nr:tyrosine-type recombinase/integrase [Bdellovibrionota bacterium]
MAFEKLSKFAKAVKNAFAKALQKRRKTPQKNLPAGPKKGRKKGPKEPASPSLPQPVLEAPRPISAIESFAEVQLSEHSKRAYRRDLQDFIGYLRAQNLLEDWNTAIGPTEVAAYRDHLSQIRGLAKSSVTRKLAVIKSFYKWALAQGWVLRNPAELVRGFPQTQDSKTGFLTDAEVDLMLAYFDKFPELGLTKEAQKVTVHTLLMLGVRRSEAASIDVGHIKYEAGKWLLLVQGKGHRDRLLPIPERLLETIENWLQRLFEDAPMGSMPYSTHAWVQWIAAYRDQPLLISTKGKSKGQRLSSAEIAWTVRKVARKAGIANRISPHVLRATAITHALDQGASHRGVQQMAGWTSPLMISRYDKRRNDPEHSAVHKLRYAKSHTDSPSDSAREGVQSQKEG